MIHRLTMRARRSQIIAVVVLAVAVLILPDMVSVSEYCPMRFSLPAELFPAPPWSIGSRAYAIPAFARKYGMNCSMCHANGVFPRLNEVGYKFRRAGFRLPEEIGMSQSEKFALQNYFAAHGEDAFQFTSTRDSTTGERNNSAAFQPGEFGLWLLTGSWGKNLATQGEITFNTEGDVEIENSNVRFVYGNDHNYFTAIGGVFHPMEGYGASDRPIGLNYPLFMQTPDMRNQNMLFTMVDPSLLGIGVGYTYRGANLSVVLTNSVRPDVSGDDIEATHFFTEGNSPEDVQVIFTQFLDSKGSAITAYYYTGNTHLPQDPNGFVDGSDTDIFANRFQRGALFGTWYPLDILSIMAGADIGRDHDFDTATKNSAGMFTSWGLFGEVDVYPMTGLGVGARYDFFNPGLGMRNTMQAGSMFVNYDPFDFLQLILDYQYQRNQIAPSGSESSHSVVSQVMFVY